MTHPLLNNRYQLLEPLGQGGFAQVWRASDQRLLDRPVAVKLLQRSDDEARARFLREASSMARLEHPHIAPILDLGQDGAQAYLVTEYYPGGDLTALKTQLPDSPAQRLSHILPLIQQIAGALDYAHQQGILHRDVKPANLVRDAKGNAILTDFGLARPHDAPALTRIGATLGSMAYIAPEQAQGQLNLTGAVDQYALAVVAYELLVGEPPFNTGDSASIAAQHITQSPEPPEKRNPAVPRELSEAILQALHKEPTRRYPTCSAFSQALFAAWDAYQLRRLRELTEQAHSQMAAGNYPSVQTALQEALSLPAAANSPALQALKQLAQTSQRYADLLQDWETARQKAQQALDLDPQLPDPHGLLPALGLRAAPRTRRTPAEWTRQIAAAILAALPFSLLLALLAFRWLVRLR
ncbi:MAG: hypothetical protein OHK0052_06890 [Anaerolineales bacterium]